MAGTRIHDALAYAYDHLEEIDADLAADDEDAVKARLAGTRDERSPFLHR